MSNEYRESLVLDLCRQNSFHSVTGECGDIIMRSVTDSKREASADNLNINEFDSVTSSRLFDLIYLYFRTLESERIVFRNGCGYIESIGDDRVVAVIKSM